MYLLLGQKMPQTEMRGCPFGQRELQAWQKEPWTGLRVSLLTQKKALDWTGLGQKKLQDWTEGASAWAGEVPGLAEQALDWTGLWESLLVQKKPHTGLRVHLSLVRPGLA